MKKLIACMIAALSVHATSQANVVYEWQGNNDATPYNIALRMEFTDDAVSAGVLRMNSRYGYGLDAGLLSFQYSFPGALNPVTFEPAATAFREGEFLQMDIAFRDDHTLSGSFAAAGRDSHLFMSSNGNLFTVTGAGTDYGMAGAGCSPFAACAGATGVFRQVPVATAAQAEVPEPGSLALIGLGLAGLAGRLRGQRRKAARV